MLQRAYDEQSKRGPVDLVKLEEVATAVRTLEHGAYSMVPLHCHGTGCPMAAKCPLLQGGFTYMIGKACPLEQHLLDKWSSKYIFDLKINPDNMVETNLAGEIAKLDIYGMRISNKLAYEDFIKQQVVGVSNDGEPFYRDELHVAAIWEDQLAKRKLKLLDALLATRKSMAGAGAGISNDPSTQASAVKRILDKKAIELRATAENLKAEAAKDITPQKS